MRRFPHCGGADRITHGSAACYDFPDVVNYGAEIAKHRLSSLLPAHRRGTVPGNDQLRWLFAKVLQHLHPSQDRTVECWDLTRKDLVTNESGLRILVDDDEIVVRVCGRHRNQFELTST